jgi:hypothetical protein
MPGYNILVSKLVVARGKGAAYHWLIVVTLHKLFVV